ncbi:MAG: aminotransferase class I/II-fold pyridoxal phosphate-dependent enzyme [Ekhidna sp.]
MKNDRIYLSPPNVGEEEKEELVKVMSEGWVSTVGPTINYFEKDLERLYSDKRVLALNSGTSALHLSLILAKIGRDDKVLVSTLTFVASANVILYQGAIPIFIDSEEKSWNVDPDLLEEYLRSTASKPQALIVTHLYGVPAEIKRLRNICDEYQILLIEDAAEALGSTSDNIPLGAFGDYGILSFNGNKIITTSGGGALITNEQGYEKGLLLSTQANSGKSDYYHKDVGYNYRMSNVLAGIGVVQIGKLDSFVKKKRIIFNYYRSHLSELFEFPEEKRNEFCNRWLTTPIVKEDIDINDLITFLENRNIETRRLWRPMHRQPIFEEFDSVSNGVSEGLYEKVICLPSGTGLTERELDYVIDHIKNFFS